VSSSQSVLVAGVGNIFLGDDGFGVEVVRRLRGRPLPEAVQVVDFGIRGLDLAYALLEGRPAILIDALPRGGAPGTLYVLRPDLESLQEMDEEPVHTHGMHPLRVLRLVEALGGPLPPLLVVGCEPEATAPEEVWRMGLSAAVADAAGEAAALIESLVADILAEQGDG
jgi:hydrogenase maturation protease